MIQFFSTALILCGSLFAALSISNINFAWFLVLIGLGNLSLWMFSKARMYWFMWAQALILSAIVLGFLKG